MLRIRREEHIWEKGFKKEEKNAALLGSQAFPLEDMARPTGEAVLFV